MTEEPAAISPPKVRAGLSMYERSMLQKEERERKLQALQETLMADFTFTPSRAKSGYSPRQRSASGDSIVSSLGESPSLMGGVSTGGVSVFSRLYSAETAASRARQRVSPSVAGRSYYSDTGTKKSAASPRLEFLFKAGEEKLRARHLSDQEEAEQIKQRIEDEALKQPGVYTFRPQTKWDLVAIRRQIAREYNEQEVDKTSQTVSRTPKKEREQKGQTGGECSDEECTFKPNLKWDLIQERRNAMPDIPEVEVAREKVFVTRGEREKMERDKKYEEIELKNCTFKPKTDWSKESKPHEDNDQNYGIDATEQVEIKEAKPAVSPKFVSADTFSQDVGKDNRTRTNVRRNIAGNIDVPESPQWKKKFREIGQNTNLEQEFIAQGQGEMGTVVRGNTVMPNEESSDSTSPSKTSSKWLGRLSKKGKTKNKEADGKAKAAEAERLAKKEADRKAKAAEAERLAKEEADRKAKAAEAKRLAKEEADRKAKAAEAERLAKEEAERKAKAAEAERLAKEEAERKAKEEAERKAKAAEAERKAKEEADRKAKEEAERKAKAAEAERKAKEEADRKAKEEAERLAKEEAERLAKEEAERKAKEEAERKAKEEAERKAKEEAERKAKEEAERKAKEEAERKAKEEAERKAKEEAERKAKEEAERKAKEEAERKAKEEAERKAKEEAERKAKEEAERKAKEEAERKAKEEADRKAKEEAERLAKEEAERLAKEEAERLAKEEADRKAKEEAERLAKEEADRKAKAAEAERLAKEEADRKAKAVEAERLAKEEADRKAKEEADIKAKEETEEPKQFDAKMRKKMIEEELERLVKQTNETELGEDDPIDEDSLEALKKGAMKVCYLKKYYDVMKDEFIYFPSVAKTCLDYTLIEEAEKFYFEEEDEYPSDISAGLRSVAVAIISETEDDDMDEDYMNMLAQDVEISEEAESPAKEEADRLAKEEAERLAKEEAERKAKAAEAERLAKEEADRLAKEEADRKAKEEADRKAKEEADRKAKAAEAERLAKEEAERKAKAAEAERLAKEEAERKAKAAEAERLAKEEAERKAKAAEAERMEEVKSKAATEDLEMEQKVKEDVKSTSNDVSASIAAAKKKAEARKKKKLEKEAAKQRAREEKASKETEIAITESSDTKTESIKKNDNEDATKNEKATAKDVLTIETKQATNEEVTDESDQLDSSGQEKDAIQSEMAGKSRLAAWGARAKNLKDRVVESAKNEIGNIQSVEDVDRNEEPKMGLAGRAMSLRQRFNRATSSKSDATVESDINTEAATVGADKTAFPKVLFNDGGEGGSEKEPEIGSI